MSNAELRVDLLTGRQVVVVPTRATRPNASSPDPPLERLDDPFESGMEHETPGEHWALRDPASEANGPGWQIRIVPNRYPAVDRLGTETTTPPSELMGTSIPFEGVHDVVIECPDRRSRLIDLSTRELLEVLRAWQIRMGDFRQMRNLRSVVIFRNEGFSAGASLAHCHSQLIATRDLIPEHMERNRREREYRSRTGRSLSEAWLEYELTEQTRILHETERLVVLCPYASRVGWQCTIVPRCRSDWNFSAVSEDSLQAVTQLLRCCHAALIAELGHFSFNLLLVHSPLDAEPEFPWMLEIVPRLSRTAGWELQTGIEIVTTAPEEAASRLRSYMKEPLAELTEGRPLPNGLLWMRSDRSNDQGITN